jgi:hypothetical protein
MKPGNDLDPAGMPMLSHPPSGPQNHLAHNLDS